MCSDELKAGAACSLGKGDGGMFQGLAVVVAAENLLTWIRTNSGIESKANPPGFSDPNVNDSGQDNVHM